VIHLNPDISPQGGIEILCIKVETINEIDGLPDIEGRILEGDPILTMPKGRASLFGKRLMMIRFLYLLAGPTIKSVRQFTSCVYSLLADQGVEIGLADYTDILEYVSEKPKEGIPPELCNFLFPKSMRLPDLNHVIDNGHKEALQSLRFWSPFLATFREAVKYLNLKQNCVKLAGKFANGEVCQRRSTASLGLKTH